MMNASKQGAIAEICVAHLVRKANGIEPFRSFVASYRTHAAGMDHDLVLLYKGFDGETDCAAYEALVHDLPHQALFVSDKGYDLRVYFFAAETLQHRYICFMNSFSQILAHQWLAKLWGALQDEGVALVGATGSWGSLYPTRRTVKKRSLLKAMAYPFFWHLLRLYRWFSFDPFPNYHLRTNAFLMERKVMLSIQHGPLETKMGTLRFESGKKSLTRQIMHQGYGVRVVDCEGKSFAEQRWNQSDTFWHGQQAKLLVSDNQSRKFDVAQIEEKQRLTLFAWGNPDG